MAYSSFEAWKSRPVYATQCRTWALAAELNECSVRFRALPAYRDAAAKKSRSAVAKAIWPLRHNREKLLALYTPPLSRDI